MSDLQHPLHNVLAEGVALGHFPGAVGLVAEAGQITHFSATGHLDPSRTQPMPPDAIFWIASMTKPITTAAALLLVEDGRLRLDDAVADHLPALRSLRLLCGAPAPSPTVRDLMCHTAGFTYGPFGEGPVHMAYRRAGVYDFRQTNQKMVERLATLPLLHTPGTTFEYGMSTDVLGALIEVCSGQTLGDFMRARLFGPLGMEDTGFELSPTQRQRVARPFPSEASPLMPPTHGARWQSGGSGLWSTARDYLRFAQMLLDHGRYPGGQLLSVESAHAMRTQQLPVSLAWGDYVDAMGPIAPTPAMGQGFGLGLSVRLDDDTNPLPGHVGDFSWPGVSGCLFWGDPRHQWVVVAMLQAPSHRLTYRAKCRQAMYGTTPASLEVRP